MLNAVSPRKLFVGTGTRGPYQLQTGGASWRVLDASHLVVRRFASVTDENDEGTLLVLNTDYTVNNTDVDNVTVTLTVAQAVLTSSQRLEVSRIQTPAQALSIALGGDYSGPSVAAAFDKVGEYVQELFTQVNRRVVSHWQATDAPFIPTPPTSGIKYLALDTTGKIIATGAPVELDSITPDASWTDALTNALGARWEDAFGVPLGENWPDALGNDLGEGWPDVLALAPFKFYGTQAHEVEPLGNTIETMTSFFVQAETQFTNKREFAAIFSLYNTKGSTGDAGGPRDKVPLYASIHSTATGGDAWAGNFLHRAGPGWHGSGHIVEFDLDQISGFHYEDLGIPSLFGISVTGAGTHLASGAVLLSGPGINPLWTFGFLDANNSVRDISFMALSDTNIAFDARGEYALWPIDIGLADCSASGIGMRLPNHTWIAATNFDGDEVLPIIRLNSSDEIELGGAINFGGLITLESADPRIVFRDMDGASVQGMWRLMASGGNLVIQRDDGSEDFVGATNPIFIANTDIVSFAQSPLIPLPADGDSTLKAAPTAWVLARIAALGGFSGTLTGASPTLTFVENDQGATNGRWRWTASGGAYVLQRNTAGTSDFATVSNTMVVNNTDVVDFLTNPTVPNLPFGENSTKVVNAAFVHDAIAAIGGAVGIDGITVQSAGSNEGDVGGITLVNFEAGLYASGTDNAASVAVDTAYDFTWNGSHIFNDTVEFNAAAQFDALATFTAGVQVASSAPFISFLETDQSLPAGAFRLGISGGSLLLQRNTHVSGNYGTASNTIVIGNDDVATFVASPIIPVPVDGDNSTKAAPTAWVKARIAEAVVSGITDGDYGDLTVSGGGTVFTIDADAVTYSKIQNVSATDRLLGRDTAGAGNIEELTVGGGLEFSGSGGILRSALTGDVTASAGSGSTTIANDAVTFQKMQNISTDRLIGRDSTGSGDPEEITVGGGLEWTTSGGIQRSALTGDVTASAGSGSTTIANDAVTYAKMQNVSADSRILGRKASAGAGDVQEMTPGDVRFMLEVNKGFTLQNDGAGVGDNLGIILLNTHASLVAGATGAAGEIALNTAHTNTWTNTQHFQSIFPRTTETYDVGASIAEWNNIYSQNAVTVSDMRRKNDKGQIGGAEALTFIAALTPRWFSFKDTQTPDGIVKHGRRHAGFFAQEYAEAMLGTVGDFGGYAYNDKDDVHELRLLENIAVLTAGVQMLDARTQALDPLTYVVPANENEPEESVSEADALILLAATLKNMDGKPVTVRLRSGRKLTADAQQLDRIADGILAKLAA